MRRLEMQSYVNACFITHTSVMALANTLSFAQARIMFPETI